ncbi:LOW QUALITY PROTEIN: hypothetical protein MAR_031983 [Mya arenaria]|uniref:Uncharacterized protein n=1 Tax=Mya arenaria TaxID=6604 RepID=A0ABY7F9C4_MYAAR|nr:LOW QUALITY PROTEIN: hypothetical protein MAR_031983 [Mya arenaria]
MGWKIVVESPNLYTEESSGRFEGDIDIFPDDGLMRREDFLPVTFVYRTQIFQNLTLFFQSCKSRADYIGSQILANQEFIKDGYLPLSYHLTIARRSSSIAFDWKEQCFMCGEKCDTIRDKGCLTKYYDINLKTDQINSNISQTFRYRSAAFQLKEEFYHEPKEEDFGDNVETYRSFYFKIILQDVWPELTIVYQNGKSDLVCSKYVTVGEALRDYKELEQSLHDASDEDIEIDVGTDESIVHKAFDVLKTNLAKY